MKLFNMLFRVAACVVVAALAVYAGRRIRTHFGVRSSVAEWSAKIANVRHFARVRERGCQAPGERRLHRAKLFPRIYTHGFLNPDVEYFK